MNTVLAIDDDVILSELIRLTLQAPDRDVITLNTGADALVRLSRTAPDLVLLDLELPDVQGLEILRHFRENPAWAETRIVILTASHDLDNIIAAKTAGANGYICKPFQPETLNAMVTDILGQRDLVWLDDYTRSRKAS